MTFAALGKIPTRILHLIKSTCATSKKKSPVLQVTIAPINVITSYTVARHVIYYIPHKG